MSAPAAKTGLFISLGTLLVGAAALTYKCKRPTTTERFGDLDIAIPSDLEPGETYTVRLSSGEWFGITEIPDNLDDVERARKGAISALQAMKIFFQNNNMPEEAAQIEAKITDI